MVFWGGLRPIATQLVVDIFTLSGLGYAAWTTPSKANVAAMVVSCLLVLVLSGLTSRWTLSFPMVPFVVLQAARRIPALSGPKSRWWITVLCTLLILLGAVLSILFPAVELPPIDGPYSVGVVDLFLPVNLKDTANETVQSTRISVRLLYPTLQAPDIVPQLTPKTAAQFCHETMKFGAPPGLKDFGWLLHTWRLTGLRLKRNAKIVPVATEQEFPVVVFSHGLGGTADIYMYQTMALAAHGAVVLSVNHHDGSAPVLENADGSVSTYDHEIAQLLKDKKPNEYVRARRARTDDRVEEVVAATEALLRLNESDLPELQKHGLSLRHRLQKDHTFFMGHSFGGATALTAGMRRSDLVKAVIAHEPAVDWMPDDSRRSLFADDRLKGLKAKFSGGTGGFVDDYNEKQAQQASVHNVDILVLSSHEWKEKEWGWCNVVAEMHQAGRLGPENGNSHFGVIEGAHHTEFSDTSMLMPLWLARATGVTGQRNPLDTAKEIAQYTRAFVDKVRA